MPPCDKWPRSVVRSRRACAGPDAVRAASKNARQRVYSPWTEGRLDAMLDGSEVDTLVVTGGETDICVLATVLGAVDRGFRVVLVSDAICSSADQTHDALMELYLALQRTG
jgi:nicotinamidase-related amidase